MQVGEKGLVQGRRNRGVRRPMILPKKRFFLKNKIKIEFYNGNLCLFERQW